MGKCPYCNKVVGSLNGDQVEVNVDGRSWKAVVYSCVSCNAVLSTQIDPIAIKADTVTGVVKELKKRT